MVPATTQFSIGGVLLDDEETLTAYHEAGHAVVGYALGGDIESLQLGGEADHDLPARFGDCRINWGRVDPQLEWQRQREILTLLAGPVAETIYRGEPFDPTSVEAWQDDWRRAWEIGAVFEADRVRRTAVLRRLMLRLDRLVRSDRCWSAVSALADELLAHEFLERDQVEEILAFWIG
jgi:hypothetical protein